MKHLKSFSLFEIRKVRDYRQPENSPYAYEHQDDPKATEKIRLQVAPLYAWYQKAVDKLAQKWNQENPDNKVSVRKLEEYNPYNPQLEFLSDYEYEQDGYAFTCNLGAALISIVRVGGKLTVDKIKNQQVIFAPDKFEASLHRLIDVRRPHFDKLLDNEGDFLAKEPEFEL